MRVEMLEDRLAAPDGITIVRLDAGCIVDLPDDLAARYVERGQAKADGPAPENKDAGAAPENKASGSRVSGKRKPRQARGDV